MRTLKYRPGKMSENLPDCIIRTRETLHFVCLEHHGAHGDRQSKATEQIDIAYYTFAPEIT